MPFAVKIKPSNYVFYVQTGETVLDAAIRQGFDFPYSCRSATCATCMGKVLKGSINYGNLEPYALDVHDQEQGFALFCSAYPESDLIIEMEDVYGPEYRPARTAEYTVITHEKVSSNIHHLVFAPATEKFIDYTAGQYCNLQLTDGIQFSFTIANAPRANHELEFYIRELTDNRFIQELLAKTHNKEKISLKGPYGKVVYHQEPSLPIIFVAGGTGIVLASAILEAMIQLPNPQHTQLYWGVSELSDLHLDECFKAWAKSYDWFSYIPVYSGKDSTWMGRKGLVHEAVLSDHPNLAQTQIYASGPDDMVFAASKAFQDCGLKTYAFYSDTLELIKA